MPTPKRVAVSNSKSQSVEKERPTRVDKDHDGYDSDEHETIKNEPVQDNPSAALPLQEDTVQLGQKRKAPERRTMPKPHIEEPADPALSQPPGDSSGGADHDSVNQTGQSLSAPSILVKEEILASRYSNRESRRSSGGDGGRIKYNSTSTTLKSTSQTASGTSSTSTTSKRLSTSSKASVPSTDRNNSGALTSDQNTTSDKSESKNSPSLKKEIESDRTKANSSHEDGSGGKQRSGDNEANGGAESNRISSSGSNLTGKGESDQATLIPTAMSDAEDHHRTVPASSTTDTHTIPPATSNDAIKAESAANPMTDCTDVAERKQEATKQTPPKKGKKGGKGGRGSTGEGQPSEVEDKMIGGKPKSHAATSSLQPSIPQQSTTTVSLSTAASSLPSASSSTSSTHSGFAEPPPPPPRRNLKSSSKGASKEGRDGKGREEAKGKEDGESPTRQVTRDKGRQPSSKSKERIQGEVTPSPSQPQPTVGPRGGLAPAREKETEKEREQEDVLAELTPMANESYVSRGMKEKLQLIRFCLNDTASEIDILKNRLSLSGRTGYRSARTTHGIQEGHFYFEIKVVPKDYPAVIDPLEQQSDKAKLNNLVKETVKMSVYGNKFSSSTTVNVDGALDVTTPHDLYADTVPARTQHESMLAEDGMDDGQHPVSHHPQAGDRVTSGDDNLGVDALMSSSNVLSVHGKHLSVDELDAPDWITLLTQGKEQGGNGSDQEVGDRRLGHINGYDKSNQMTVTMSSSGTQSVGHNRVAATNTVYYKVNGNMVKGTRPNPLHRTRKVFDEGGTDGMLVSTLFGKNKPEKPRSLQLRNQDNDHLNIAVINPISPSTNATGYNTGQFRVGFSLEKGDLQLPVGGDEWGYGFGSAKGLKFHRSQAHPYSDPIRPGDVIGCHLFIPPVSLQTTDDALLKVMALATSSDIDPQLKQLTQYQRVRGSFVRYYKNGVSLGDAFTDVPGGVYFPTVSLYQDITVSVNFGPYFAYPIPELTRLSAASIDPDNSMSVFAKIADENDLRKPRVKIPKPPAPPQKKKAHKSRFTKGHNRNVPKSSDTSNPADASVATSSSEDTQGTEKKETKEGGEHEGDHDHAHESESDDHPGDHAHQRDTDHQSSRPSSRALDDQSGDSWHSGVKEESLGSSSPQPLTSPSPLIPTFSTVPSLEHESASPSPPPSSSSFSSTTSSSSSSSSLSLSTTPSSSSCLGALQLPQRKAEWRRFVLNGVPYLGQYLGYHMSSYGPIPSELVPLINAHEPQETRRLFELPPDHEQDATAEEDPSAAGGCGSSEWRPCPQGSLSGAEPNNISSGVNASSSSSSTSSDSLSSDLPFPVTYPGCPTSTQRAPFVYPTFRWSTTRMVLIPKLSVVPELVMNPRQAELISYEKQRESSKREEQSRRQLQREANAKPKKQQKGGNTSSSSSSSSSGAIPTSTSSAASTQSSASFSHSSSEEPAMSNDSTSIKVEGTVTATVAMTDAS